MTTAAIELCADIPTACGRWTLQGTDLVWRHHPGGPAYVVALETINDSHELLDWILHVAGKGDGMELGNVRACHSHPSMAAPWPLTTPAR